MSKAIITLKKSVIGSRPEQIATIKALGLKRPIPLLNRN